MFKKKRRHPRSSSVISSCHLTNCQPKGPQGQQPRANSGPKARRSAAPWRSMDQLSQRRLRRRLNQCWMSHQFFLGTWSATFGFTLDELMIIDAHLDAHSDSQWTAVVCENTNGCSVVFLKTYGPRAEGNISRSKTEVAINGSTP